jgi:hypothetical protein
VFVFVLCTLCCKILWIVHFLTAPSIFSNVYLSYLEQWLDYSQKEHRTRHILLVSIVFIKYSVDKYIEKENIIDTESNAVHVML